MVFSLAYQLQGQQRLGINTSTPLRILELASSSEPYLRVHSSVSGGQAGIELVRGLNGVDVDWKITNDNGTLKFIHGDDNFATAGSEAMRIGTANNMGIATTTPQTKLHIDAGSPIIFGGYGYIKMGSHTGVNLIADNQQYPLIEKQHLMNLM